MGCERKETTLFNSTGVSIKVQQYEFCETHGVIEVRQNKYESYEVDIDLGPLKAIRNELNRIAIEEGWDNV